MSLVGIGRKPHLKVVKHVTAPPEAPLEVVIEALKPSNLLFFVVFIPTRKNPPEPAAQTNQTDQLFL